MDTALRREGVHKSLSKECREMIATGALQIDESVTEDEVAHLEGLAVDPEPSAAANSAFQSSRKRQAVQSIVAQSAACNTLI